MKTTKKSSLDLNEQLNVIQDVSADMYDRRIYLVGDVDVDMSWKAITALRFLRRQDPSGDITVVLDSAGGDVTEGWAIYDFFRKATKTMGITVYGIGQVQSMAAILLQMASPGRRFLLPNCRFMIHNGWQDVGKQHSSVMIALGREQEIGNRQYAACLARHNSIALDLTSIEALCLHESYMSAQEAVNHGFADAVVEVP